MTAVQQFPTHAWARTYVSKYGLSLVKLPPGKKYPTHDHWEQPEGQIADPDAAREFYQNNPAFGMGVVLGPSRLCSLDVDNAEETRLVLSEFGIDVDAWADEYPTVVGNPARFRIEFRVPDGVELSTHKLQWPDKSGKTKHVVFELRAGNVQDVLPPTLHPETGQPYTWRTKPNGEFLPLPEALLTIWENWDVFAQNARALCPWASAAEAPRPPKSPQPRQDDAGSVIVAYNQAHEIENALEFYGYKKVGKRFLSPHSKTRLPGVVMLDGNRAWIHHASDPLGGETPVNPFDLYCYYEHGNDVAKAVKGAAAVLGIAHKTRAERRREHIDPDTGEILQAEPPESRADTDDKRPVATSEADDNRPFTPLGFNAGVYYYLAAGTQQIAALTPAQHSKANLMHLARLTYWEREFPKKAGADWDMAADTLMRWCEQRGVFDPSLMRGRGAWYDDGRILVHLGDRVLVEGVPMRPGRVDSRFVYEAKLPMRANLDRPLSASEAKKFLDLVQMAAWERPLYGVLLAGWCVVAHIGGVLPWRPHIWVVGRRGSGKTHVMAHMVRPVLGDNLLHVQGDTSEAGIRQMLGVDALPVLFDEAEGEDARANDRVQAVLALVRQSSSETGGSIFKGTTGGKAQAFNIRSCFAMSSITANLMQQSDRSRVTVLELNQDHSKHAFADILAAEANLLSGDFAPRFYARALTMAATIRRNAAMFAAAAAGVLGEQRAGDQIGALLAGAYSLESDDALTAEQAREWVLARDWSEQRDEAQAQSDEAALWSHLMQQRMRVQTDMGADDVQIGLLLDVARGQSKGTGISRDRAEDILLRAGFRLTADNDTVCVSNSHADIKRMLNNTPWAANWARTLRRLPSAAGSASAVYFGFKGSESRATIIPL